MANERHLIDRDLLLDNITAETIKDSYDAKLLVLEQPVVSSPEGEWEELFIEDNNPFLRHRFLCTACGEWNTYGKSKYCPNCGARMEFEDA